MASLERALSKSSKGSILKFFPFIYFSLNCRGIRKKQQHTRTTNLSFPSRGNGYEKKMRRNATASVGAFFGGTVMRKAIGVRRTPLEKIRPHFLQKHQNRTRIIPGCPPPLIFLERQKLVEFFNEILTLFPPPSLIAFMNIARILTKDQPVQR